MSFDLAVWEGEQPASDEDASRTFGQLYEQYVEPAIASGSPIPPTERIAAYVAGLLGRYPDLTDIDEEDDEAEQRCPWSDGPLIANANGPLFYFGFVTNQAAEEAFAYAVDLARSSGLVCFDPQSNGLAI